MKKCLACEQKFDGKMNICQSCFSAIENVRGQFDSFPRGFRRGSYVIGRKFILLSAGIIIITHTVILSLATSIVLSLFSKVLIYNKFLLILNLYLPIILLCAFSLYFGRIIGQKLIIKLIKRWLDKEWYFIPTESWRSIKQLLSEQLPLFIFLFIAVTIMLILRSIVLSDKTVKSFYVLAFYMGLGLGVRALFGFFLVGLMLSFRHATDWIAKLSK